MLAQLLKGIAAYCSTLPADQWIAIAVVILAVSCAIKMVKKGLSIAFTVIGGLAALYYFAPDLYDTLFRFLGNLWGPVAGALA